MTDLKPESIRGIHVFNSIHSHHSQFVSPVQCCLVCIRPIAVVLYWGLLESVDGSQDIHSTHTYDL